MKCQNAVNAFFAVLLLTIVLTACTDKNDKQADIVESPDKIDMKHFWYRFTMDSPGQGTMTMEYMVEGPHFRINQDIKKGEQKGGVSFLCDGQYLYILDGQSKTALRYDYNRKIAGSFLPENLNLHTSFKRFKSDAGIEPKKTGEDEINGIKVKKYEFNGPESATRSVAHVDSSDVIRRLEVFRKEAGKLFLFEVQKLVNSPQFPENTFQLPENYNVKTNDLPPMPDLPEMP